MKTLKRLACLMLCTAMLSGCSSQTSLAPNVALPPSAAGPEAPIGDAGLQQEIIAALHLPSQDGQTLLTFYAPLTISRDQHPAQAILQALLSHPGNSRVRPVAGTTALSLYGADPVEISGSLCTVNLSASALSLSSQDLYTAALSIAATLCELDDIDYVNLLIAGRPVAMDISGNLPLGLLTAPPAQELPVLWEQMASRRTPVGELPAHTPLTTAAALYFPLADGTGITAEARRIAFPGQHPQQQVITLLSALSAGADTLAGIADMPDLNAMLLFKPEVTDLESGGRRVTLHFTADVKERITAAGCDPACMFAAITTTLTSFVPSLHQVCILMGDGALTSLYSPTLGSQLFPGALMTRAAFTQTLMGQTTVYIPDGRQLAASTLSLPYRSVIHPRAVLLAMASPAVGALPSGLTDADILGLSVQGDTLLVNLSARYAQTIRQSGMDQRLMVYAVVNTLCEMLDVRRVRFFFAGEQLPDLEGSVAWDGEFLYHPALIAQ